MSSPSSEGCAPRRGWVPRDWVWLEPRHAPLGARGLPFRVSAARARVGRVPLRGSARVGWPAVFIGWKVLLLVLLFLCFFTLGGLPVVPRPVVICVLVTGPEQQLASNRRDGAVVGFLLELDVVRLDSRPDTGEGGCLRDASRGGPLPGVPLAVPRGDHPRCAASLHRFLVPPSSQAGPPMPRGQRGLL